LKNLKDGSTEVLTNDIGEGGVRFKSNEFISLACRLLLEINLPTIVKPVKAISKVAWIRKTPERKEYEIGNQFLEMSKEDREHIVSFINRLLKTSI
jgi:c-di-GMP-binding flagellar brake protein YcgR